MKRANTMSTITVELIITMKTKFTSSNAEKTNGFISPQMSHNFHKMCLRPQRGAFSRALRAQTVASKNRCLPQCEAFSADFAGRRSICALRRAKITEGERVVPPVVALNGSFCAQTLAGAVFQKEKWPPHSSNSAAAEAVRWPRLFVKYLPRGKL